MKCEIYKTNRLIVYPFAGILMLVLAGTVSCKKYLEEKPAQNLAVPSTVKDLRAILDNALANIVSPPFAEFNADNYYLQTGTWSSLPEELRQLYIWNPNARINANHIFWSAPYKVIYEANFVLDLLTKVAINPNERAEAENIKGTAFFHRAFMFHQMAQLFCRPYSSTATTDPGIVIRTKPDVNEPVTRATVEETYLQIINDLKESAKFLPTTQSINTRPNKAAAYGALARVYLSMADYANSEVYADTSLMLYKYLIDYNTLTPAAAPVLPASPLNNPEILFMSGNTLASVFYNNHGAVPDSVLYESYQVNDLRKTIFFGASGKNWNGSYDTYSGEFSIFDGIATDEVVLIRSESRIRNGNLAGGLDDLNYLLQNRWRAGTFTPVTASNDADGLSKVLAERRKELAFRGLRLSDLRRFNLEGANITLTRIINNTTYSLPPNDLRWVSLIPDVEINRSGIAQNPR